MVHELSSDLQISYEKAQKSEDKGKLIGLKSLKLKNYVQKKNLGNQSEYLKNLQAESYLYTE